MTSPPTTLTADHLAAEIRRLGLLERPGDLDNLARAAGTATALVGQLVESGALTPFQAECLLAGRGDRLVLRQYVLLEQVGAGGMGQVFRARHRVLGRIDAIKVIRPDCVHGDEAVRRFRQEAQLAARCAHPNLVPVYDADTVDGTHFLAMEYVPGTDLHRLVRRDGPVSWPRACEYVRQAALGLHHAHERGLIHRDVKPGNLVLAAGRVRVLDLGLARLREPRADGDDPLTASHLLLGTPDFLPPEQFRDPRTVDPRSDVYALGCTLYFLLTGRPPFAGGSGPEKLLRHQSERPPALGDACPGLPPEVAQLVTQMLDKDPGRRPATAAAVADRLAPFAAATDTATEPTSVADTGIAPSYVPRLPDPTPVLTLPSRRRFRWRLPAAAAVVVLAVGLGVRFWPQRTPEANGPGPPAGGADRPSFEPAAVPTVARQWALRHRQQTEPRAGYAVAFVPSGRSLVLVSGDSTEPMNPAEVRVWDVAGNAERWKDTVATNAHCLSLAPDGERFAVGTGDWKASVGGQVSVWEVETRARRDFAAHPTGVLSLAYAPTGARLVSGGRDGRLRVWDMTGAEGPPRLADRDGHAGGVTALAFHPMGELLASGGADGVVKLWGGELWDQPEVLPGGAAGPVRGLAFADGGRRLVAAVESGPTGMAELRFWNVADRQAAGTVPVAHGTPGHPFLGLHRAADDRTLFVCGEGPDRAGMVWLIDAVTRQDLGFVRAADEPRPITSYIRVYAVATSADGRHLATTGADASLNLWAPGGRK